MRKPYAIALLSTIVLFYAGCQKQIDLISQANQGSRADSLTPCGHSFDTTLINYDGLLSGSIKVLNDQAGYHVVIREVFTDYKITRVQLLYGTRQHVIDNIVGLTNCATMQPRNPDKVVNYTPDQDSVVVIDLPFDTLSCIYMNANITLAKRDALGNLLHAFNIWSNGTANPSQNPCQQYFQFCRQQCNGTPPPPTADTSCGQLRTQTQKGWGETPSGNNTGSYLHTNFAGAFASGLKVGCTGGYSITMTTAEAITNLLPTEGKAEPIRNNYTNPTSFKNALVGELIALTLNVGFDKYDANFGQAGKHLENMYIRKGKFRGKTVGEFLDIANKMLGKCMSPYKAEDITNTAKKINENYKNGNTDKHRLVCRLSDCSHDEDDDDDHDDDHDHHDDDDD